MNDTNHKSAVTAADPRIHPDDASFVRFLLAQEAVLDTATEFLGIVRRLAATADYRATVSEGAVETRDYFRLLMNLALIEDRHHDERRAARAKRDRADAKAGLPF
ncbi:hypothetical protein ABS771_19975 [Methylobacterium brachiatum]|uniref:Terminase small subunit n=1 Tax=Methylobacterium brachiatum TaxID=269660 RepID=A0ABV1R4V9_9HYPH